MKRFSFYSVSLKTQCLAMVGLILAGELIFVLALLLQLQQAGYELIRESQLKEIFRRSQTFVYMLNDYQNDLESWFKHKDSNSEQAILEKEKQMRSDCRWLLANTKTYPEVRKKIEELDSTQESLFRIVSKAKSLLKQMTQPMQAMAFVQRFVSKGQKLRRDWEHQSVNLLSDEQVLLDGYSKTGSKRRTQIRMLLWAGLVGNICIVLVFAAFFFGGIKKRLQIMSENTRRLPLKEPLAARLEDKDEIGLLDHEFHLMAENIEAAQKERQAFLAMVSHELRTPLMSVSTTFELSAAGLLGELSASGLALASDCERELAALIRLINDLLDLEKLEAGKLSINKRIVYLESIVERAIEQLQEEAQLKNTTIKTAAEIDCELEADPERLSQALANVLKNAIQMSPQESLVEIEAEETDQKINLKILDRGPGINPELAKVLFERFRQLPESSNEVIRGMGLPIAKEIIRIHQGQISYCPRDEGGSVFEIELPRLQSP